MQKLFVICSTIFLSGGVVCALSDVHLVPDIEKTYLTEVQAILQSEKRTVPGTDIQALYQTIKVKVVDGAAVGKEITLDDSTYGVSVGDKVYVKYVKTSEGSEYYSLSEPYRLPQMAWLFALFVLCVLFFGGKQGFLSLVALSISCYAMLRLLFPVLLTGTNPIIISLLIALVSLGIAMYVTHGFKRFTTAAYLGCLLAVAVTAVLAYVVAIVTHLTGFATEESVYLNMATHGIINFQALITSAMIIGVIGIVNDAAITQTSLVQELYASSKTITKKEVYRSAMKVGRDHIGGLVNTLVFAYVGASLPVTLLFFVNLTTTPVLELINREMIATELIRLMIGSIGLLLAIPCATLIGVFIIKRDVLEKGAHVHHH